MVSASLAFLIAFQGTPTITSRTVDYQWTDNRTTFQGVLVGALDPAKPKPGVLIVHQWGGITDHERGVARRLAELGYVAFCADVYGKGIRPTETAEKSRLATQYKTDRALLRRNLQLAYDEFVRWPGVDRNRIAAIGYCFGGTAVLEMARAGMPLRGVVSFHGNLDNPDPSNAAKIGCPVLVLHGADDPFVPADEVKAFKAEMDAAKKPYEFIAYPGAVHSFTQREAGNDPKRGAAFNEQAERESWKAMRAFLDRVFGAGERRRGI